MNINLDKQLCTEFPLLYSNRYMGKQQSSMHYGFSCADGWFQIIYDLSKKLEPLIQKHIDENKDELVCRYCTRKEKDHTQYYTFTEDGNTSIPIQDIVQYTSEDFIDVKNLFQCKKFESSYPKASQVKEKFGGLCFYMDSATKEMYDIIHLTEEQSYFVCEECSKTGQMCSDGGWIRTLCMDCVSKYNKGFDDGFGFRIRRYVPCSKNKKGENNGNEEESE